VRDPLPQSVLFLPDDWGEGSAKNPGLKTQIFPSNNPGFLAEPLKGGSIPTSFEGRLEISLPHKRSRKMTTQPKAVPPIPEGYHSVTPWIISRETAKLLDFMSKAFGAQEMGRVYNEDGTLGHAEVKLGDSIVMAFDARKEWPATPCFLRLYVPDADVMYQQALAAGATAVTEMTSLSFGDRVGRVRDPFGNLWWIQTRLENLAPEEMAKRAAEPRYREAMRSFQESLDREMKRRSEAESRTESSR
jgi:PhnB protein